MSYDSKRIEYGKEKIYVVDLLMSYCSLTHSVAPCTATGTGDARCYNTLESCQDLPNYFPVSTLGHFRFYQGRSPAPAGLAGSLISAIDPIPSLQSVSISPAEIDVSGGLGVRASVTCTFIDHPHSDINVDKYVDGRTFIASERGSFWTKFRARHPNYQFKEMRVLSGYLEDDGSFDINNFQTRYYVIDKLTVTNGKCTITGKDPLKLASNKKAQAPAPSAGLLQADITASATTATLIPAGVGNLEYPTSGKVLIKDEVISFTRSSDVLTLTRAQNNTTATTHSANDTVQLCLEYIGKQVNYIVNDLLTNYANIDTNFIPTTAWQAEIDTYLSGFLSGIIVKPYDVFKLLIELSEAMPHYLWWDERSQEIQLTALKAPPTSSAVINMGDNIIADSFRTTDKPEMRKSTIFVNFGQFNPTKKLDEPGNYQQTYARIDTDSISTYGSNEIKVINSRWITNTNKAAALQLAALYGRRFANIPRMINFSLEAKDADVWAGQTKAINHRDITDFSGSPVDTIFQITSVRESKNFDYQALEFNYGDALPSDEGGASIDLVYISIDSTNYNLRTEYELLFPTPTAATVVKFIVDGGTKVGSTSVSSVSLDTGSWPTGAQVTLQINANAFVVGKGGNGADKNGVGVENGGDAITLNYDLELINNGVIGAGGGGSGYKLLTGGGETARVAGAGGAGYVVGSNGGINAFTNSSLIIDDIQASDGSTQTGGNAGELSWFTGGTLYTATSGKGGDLGSVGETATSAGGGTGSAINKNGHTLTETNLGTVYGAINA